MIYVSKKKDGAINSSYTRFETYDEAYNFIIDIFREYDKYEIIKDVNNKDVVYLSDELVLNEEKQSYELIDINEIPTFNYESGKANIDVWNYEILDLENEILEISKMYNFKMANKVEDRYYIYFDYDILNSPKWKEFINEPLIKKLPYPNNITRTKPFIEYLVCFDFSEDNPNNASQ